MKMQSQMFKKSENHFYRVLATSGINQTSLRPATIFITLVSPPRRRLEEVFCISLQLF
jgi:hypothetical protein